MRYPRITGCDFCQLFCCFVETTSSHPMSKWSSSRVVLCHGPTVRSTFWALRHAKNAEALLCALSGSNISGPKGLYSRPMYPRASISRSLAVYTIPSRTIRRTMITGSTSYIESLMNRVEDVYYATKGDIANYYFIETRNRLYNRCVIYFENIVDDKGTKQCQGVV